MTIKYYPEMIQGSEEWFAVRCGMITAGSMKLILTPKTLKVASNDKERGHLYELLAQRVTGYVEPSYISDDMLRGMGDEILARALYSEKYAPVQEVGLVTNDQWGFTMGYSPDGMVGDDGMIECKSRAQKYQAQTFVEGEVPEEYLLQIHTGLLVTGRKWCDFISYCGGMPMFVKRVTPNPDLHKIIVDAARGFEARLIAARARYDAAIVGFEPTERTVEEEITV